MRKTLLDLRLAVVVALALAGEASLAQQKHVASSEDAVKSKQLDRIAIAIEEAQIGQAADYGCPDFKPNYRSDLCAQWIAAKGAHDSARWSLWTMISGIIGLVVGGGTLLAAWRAAHWARKAAEHTEDAAKEAARSANLSDIALQHTQKLSHLQLRAYLDLDAPKVSSSVDGSNGGASYRVSSRLHNYGDTPARQIQYQTLFTFSDRPPEYDDLETQRTDSVAFVSRGDHFGIIENLWLAEEQCVLLREEDHSNNLWWIIKLRYMDVFSTAYERSFRLVSFDGEEWFMDNDLGEHQIDDYSNVGLPA